MIALKAIGMRYSRQMLKEADQTLPIAAEMGELPKMSATKLRARKFIDASGHETTRCRPGVEAATTRT